MRRLHRLYADTRQFHTRNLRIQVGGGERGGCPGTNPLRIPREGYIRKKEAGHSSLWNESVHLNITLGGRRVQCILKSRDTTLPTNDHLVKAMVFPVVIYGCESWIIKKAEHWRIDTFELQYWRRLLRAPWTARGANQSVLKEISPEYSLKGLMLKLKLQYLGHLMRRANSFEKTLTMGKIEGRRKRGRQRIRWLC